MASTTAIGYEGFLKSQRFHHRLLVDIAGYHILQSDIQVGAIVNNVSAVVNAGEATSNGMEFTIGDGRIKSLSSGINGAYTHATLSDNAPSLNGKAGDRLPFIPLFSVPSRSITIFRSGADIPKLFPSPAARAAKTAKTRRKWTATSDDP